MPDDKQIAHQRYLKEFERHVKHFTQLDEALETFGREHEFALEKNQWRRPCRVLRKKGNPEYVIEISQEGNWHQIAYREDLPHTLGVVAYFVDEKNEQVYRKGEDIAYFVHFQTIQVNLKVYLDKALAHIKEWTPEVILREGAKSEHPMAYWRRQGGIKVETVD